MNSDPHAAHGMGLESMPQRLSDTALRPVSGPQAWRGEEMARNPSRWIRELTEAEVDDLERATDHALARLAGGSDLLAISSRDFPLPALGPRLAAMREDALRGIGFALLLDPAFPNRLRGRRRRVAQAPPAAPVAGLRRRSAVPAGHA